MWNVNDDKIEGKTTIWGMWNVEWGMWNGECGRNVEGRWKGRATKKKIQEPGSRGYRKSANIGSGWPTVHADRWRTRA